MKKLLLGWGIGVLSLSILVGCGGESSIEKVDGNNNENEQVNNEKDAQKEVQGERESEKEDTPSELAIGDTVNFDGLLITLNSVRTAQGDDFFKPNKDKYVIVDVIIENTNDKPENVSSMLSTSLYDASGYAQDFAIVTDTKGQLDGEVGAGRKLAGEVAFDADDSEYYEFIFENPFKSGQAIWKFEAN